MVHPQRGDTVYSARELAYIFRLTRKGVPHTLHDFCPPTMEGKDHATRVSIKAVPVSILARMPFKQCSILGFHINCLGKCRRRKLEKLENPFQCRGFKQEHVMQYVAKMCSSMSRFVFWRVLCLVNTNRGYPKCDECRHRGETKHPSYEVSLRCIRE